MTTTTVTFTLSEAEAALLDDLVEHYGDGSRSRFLTVALRRLARDRRAERLEELRRHTVQELGRTVSPGEVRAAISDVTRGLS